MYLETTPRGMLALFFRQFNKFFLTFLVVVGAGLFYITTQKPLFEASGSLLVHFGNQEVSRTSYAPAELSRNDRREIIESHVAILRSQELVETLVKTYGAETIYPGITAKVAGKDSPEQAAIKKLIQGDLYVKASQNSSLIDVDLLNENPKFAKAMLQSLFDTFMVRQSEIYNRSQTSFLQSQVERARAQLEKAQSELQDFKASHGISLIEEELTQLFKDRGDASTVSFEAVDAAQAELAKLQAEEASLLATYRADSPAVSQLQQKIAVAKRQLGARQAELKARSGGTSTGVKKRIAELEAKRKEYNDLLRQVSIFEENYKNYVLRAEEAVANETFNQRNVTRISVVDEPSVPVRPVHPRKMLIIAASILAGLLAGLGIAALAEMLDTRFTTQAQVARLLNVPVFATFGKPVKSRRHS